MTARSNNHVDDFELLSLYVDGQLAPADQRLLEARLAADPALQKTLDELRHTIQVLRAAPPLHLPRNFTLDPARSGKRSQRTVRRGRMFQIIGALGALAAILLIVFGINLSRRSAEEVAGNVVAVKSTMTDAAKQTTAATSVPASIMQSQPSSTQTAADNKSQNNMPTALELSATPLPTLVPASSTAIPPTIMLRATNNLPLAGGGPFQVPTAVTMSTLSANFSTATAFETATFPVISTGLPLLQPTLSNSVSSGQMNGLSTATLEISTFDKQATGIAKDETMTASPIVPAPVSPQLFDMTPTFKIANSSVTSTFFQPPTQIAQVAATQRESLQTAAATTDFAQNEGASTLSPSISINPPQIAATTLPTATVVAAMKTQPPSAASSPQDFIRAGGIILIVSVILLVIGWLRAR